MNALVVLLARLSTGLFLILWAYAVHANLRGAPELVTSLSLGFFADETYRMALVYGAGALGVLTVLGLVRVVVYPLLALAFLAATASVWKSLADPLGIFFFFAPSETNIFFFPMMGLFVAALVPLTLWEEDSIALDSAIGAWRDRDTGSDDAPARKGGGLRQMAMAAPLAAAASHAAHDDHGHGHAAPAHNDHAHADHGHDDHGHAAKGHDDHGHAAAHDTHDSHGHGNGHAAHH